MKIANPMYDVVFKYLIEDVECAKLLLGEIIQQEIVECELLHNEIASGIALDEMSGVLKMDFKALINTKEGKHLLVLIEVQKAMRETNLLRFRQYLGFQYSNKDNCYVVNSKKIPLPIFSIYILGYSIGLHDSIPILKVTPSISDYTDDTTLGGTCLFTESLSHEMVIIQTNILKNSRRSLLEQFLSNFMPGVKQILEVNPREFDRKYVSLLKRLELATMKKEIVELMNKENMLQQEWDELVQSKELAEKQVKVEQREKEEERKQKEEERKQKEKIEIQLKKSIQSLMDFGVSQQIISEKLSISEEEINRLMNL